VAIYFVAFLIHISIKSNAKVSKKLHIYKFFRIFATIMIGNQEESTPLVSFIIAYYELPVKWLCECLDSILALSLKPQERQIIIIDDGSVNSPLTALGAYTDDVIFLRQKHQGLGAARNTGIQIATGRYLQFVDADDQLIKSGYDHCLNLIRQHHDADMVLFDFHEHNVASVALPTAPVAPTSGTSYMRHHNIHGMACGYLVRRATLSDLRFTPSIYHEDELFTPQLLIRAEVVYPTNVKAYYYHRRPHSIVTTQDTSHVEKRQIDFLQIIRELKLMADRLPKNDQLAMERRVAQLTMDYLYNTIMLSRSLAVTRQCITQLRSEGLFPLPDRNYTTKYQWFRRLSNSKLGLATLVKVLPLMKRER
jgi:glycosyltransferase involved in cell wall biosynthesis